MAELWTSLIDLLGEYPLPSAIIGGSAILALLFLRLRKQPKKVVAYATDSGRVMVSRSAIVELVQTACAQLEEVSKPSVKIKVRGNTAHFQVHIKLASGGRLRDIEQTLQSHLRQALSENLGIEHLGMIDIVATGFKSGKIATSPKPIQAKDTPVVDVEPAKIPEVETHEPIENKDEVTADKPAETTRSKLL